MPNDPQEAARLQPQRSVMILSGGDCVECHWQGDSLTARLARNAIAALPEILAGIQRRREEHERPSP